MTLNASAGSLDLQRAAFVPGVVYHPRAEWAKAFVARSVSKAGHYSIMSLVVPSYALSYRRDFRSSGRRQRLTNDDR